MEHVDPEEETTKTSCGYDVYEIKDLSSAYVFFFVKVNDGRLLLLLLRWVVVLLWFHTVLDETKYVGLPSVDYAAL